MTARSPSAFILSATFHALLIGTALLFAYVTSQQDKVTPHVLELVAGEGSNYGATEAPALGTPGGVKIQVPSIPIPKPVREIVPPKAEMIEPEPVPVKPAPTLPKPVTPTATKKAEPVVPNMARRILRKVWSADSKAKKEVAKERAEEEKRDREQRAREVASARAAGSVKHIDAEGIAKGVVGGSTANKAGGAGGKALTREEGSLLDAYFAMLKQRVVAALDKPPGLSDELAVTVSVHISGSGHISGARVIKSSGNEAWDRAVITAFSRVDMPDYPDRKGDDLTMTFRTKDAESG